MWNKKEVTLPPKELVLCGDFNAPREGIFSKFAERFTDNLPATITSTIDPELHRRKGLSLVIDLLDAALWRPGRRQRRQRSQGGSRHDPATNSNETGSSCRAIILQSNPPAEQSYCRAIILQATREEEPQSERKSR